MAGVLALLGQRQPMPANFDLNDLLKDWNYDPESAARITRGADGREIMQVRTPLGVEQFELEGRPDGAKPHGAASAFEFYRARLERLRGVGKESTFFLSASECGELFEEGVLYYFRYLHLFQLRNWQRVIRDTARNLSVFDFVHEYAKREQDRCHLEQWRPYLLRMNVSARAILEWEAGRHAAALRIVREGIAQIEGLEELEIETFHVERQRSQEALQDLIKQIEKTQPLSELEMLERELHKAVETEQFERAASLRDRIRLLKTVA
jgi:hypothetical protein